MIWLWKIYLPVLIMETINQPCLGDKIYRSYAFYKVCLFHVLPNHPHPSRHRDSDWHETWRSTKASKVHTKVDQTHKTVKHVSQNNNFQKENHCPNKEKAVDFSSEFDINQMFIFCWKIFSSNAPLCRKAVFSQNFAKLVFSRQVVNYPPILFWAKQSVIYLEISREGKNGVKLVKVTTACQNR